MIYALHLATNTVREIYPALSLGEHFSFRVDEYAHLHPDLFEKPGFGWHINSNPGASMAAAIPYALFQPLVTRIVNRVNEQRSAGMASGNLRPPHYDSPWPMAQRFFEESWRRGLDVKFGLAALITQAFCMAPLSALGVSAMFVLLQHFTGSARKALWMALLYGFGTPVFFRAGYLNHNMMLGHVTFLGFLAMWNPAGNPRWSATTRAFLGGLAGGAGLLFDYSGVVLLLGLFVYALVRSWEVDVSLRIRRAAVYVAGTVPPVLLLWWYQYRSFGNPFYPAQHWMPPVVLAHSGYKGMSLPQPDLLVSLLVDYRYGLFTSCPLFLLAFGALWFYRRPGALLPRRELKTAVALTVALYLFCGGINYTRLQFNTGIRYLSAVFPFLFLVVAVTLERLPSGWRYFVSLAAVAQAWSMAMYRDVERGGGVLDPVLRTFTQGFQLPAFAVASHMDQFREWFPPGASPLPLLVLAGATVYGIWSIRGKGIAETDMRGR